MSNLSSPSTSRLRLPNWLCAPQWRHLRLLVFAVTAAIAIQKLLRADTDFGIVLDAARELRMGGFDIYRSHPDHGAFPYPHWVLLPILPLLSLPETWLRIGFGLSQGLATVLIVGDVRALLAPHVRVRAWHWLVFGLLFARWFSANYTNGQFSLWVAALTIHGVRALAGGRPSRAGVWIGVAAAAKLTPLIFLVALPLMGSLRAAVAMLVTVLVLVFVAPWPVLGSVEHRAVLGDLHAAMIVPLFERGAGDAAIWTGPNASIDGTLRTLLQAPRSVVGGAASPSHVHVAELSDAALRSVRVVYSLCLALLAILGGWRARRSADRLVVQAAIVTLVAALFSPLTRTYHCAMLALAGLLFVTDRAGPGGADVPRSTWRTVLWWSVLACLAFAMTLRQRALLGTELWRALEEVGTLHFGIVGILVVLASRPRVRSE